MNEPALSINGGYSLDNKYKEEKIDGVIYKMATPCDEHIDVQGNLNTIFNNYFKQNNKPCRSRQNAGLDIGGGDYLEPDLQILCRESNNGEIPVIVIEVLSKSTKKRDLGIKMKKYEKLGVKEYWIIRWETSSIEIYLLNEDNKYDFYNSYDIFTENDRLFDYEKKEIIKEFSPVSFPELVVILEDVFDLY